MKGMPGSVMSAALEVLKIEGVKSVKIVPPAGVYHIHAEIEDHSVDATTEFYRKVMALRAFNEAPVDIQSESSTSIMWIDGEVLEKEPGDGEAEAGRS